MPTFNYPPVGHCIYCDSPTTDLGDEHIIPFALNGGMVLPKASCHQCEKIIQPYEMTVARRIFGHFRIKHNVQTRNKKQRPDNIRIGTLLPNGKRGTAYVPVLDHPVMLFVYKFQLATYLQCYPPEVEKNTWLPIALSNKEELDAFIEKYHWDRMNKLVAVPVEFARQLAKIAYSYVVAEIGIGNFTPMQMTLDTIMCRTTNVCHVVGGNEELPPPDPRGMHLLGITVYMKEPMRPLIIAGLRLFPAFEMPEYHVVVGHFYMSNEQHKKTFAKKVIVGTNQVAVSHAIDE